MEFSCQEKSKKLLIAFWSNSIKTACDSLWQPPQSPSECSLFLSNSSAYWHWQLQTVSRKTSVRPSVKRMKNSTSALTHCLWPMKQSRPHFIYKLTVCPRWSWPRARLQDQEAIFFPLSKCPPPKTDVRHLITKNRKRWSVAFLTVFCGLYRGIKNIHILYSSRSTDTCV